MTDHVRIEDRDGVKILTLTRPEKKNALTHAMYAALSDAFADAHADPATRSILLTGTGDFFTSGNDLGDFMNSPPHMNAEHPAPVERFLRAMLESTKPFIVAVNGPAVGIGVTLLLHADLVYAAPQATFTAPFVDLGLVPEAASSLLLTERVGRARASEMLLLGESVEAGEAVDWGLVARVFPADRLADEAFRRAAQVAAKAPGAVRETKRLIVGDRDRVGARMAEEGRLFADALKSEEFAEAAGAFFEKRQPDFSRFG